MEGLNSRELANKIFNDNNENSEDNLIEYVKWALQTMYNDFVENEENLAQVKCSKELVEKIKNNSDLFRIHKNIDRMYVNFADICNYDNTKEIPEIKIKTSIVFYDNTENNENVDMEDERMWNDNWIVTLINDASTENSTCAKCGANMDFDIENDMLNCKYCGNKVFNATRNKWRIMDIEVQN